MSIYIDVKSSKKLFCTKARSNGFNRNIFGQLVGPHFPSHFARKHLSVLVIETSPLQNINTMIRYVPNGCLRNICANVELSNELLRNEIRFNSSNRDIFGQLIKLAKESINEGDAYVNWFGRLSWRNEQGRQCRLRKPTILHASDRYSMSIYMDVKSSKELFCTKDHSNGFNRNIFGQLVGPHSPSHFARKRLSVLIIETSPLQNVNTMIRYVPNGCLKNICANVESSNGLLRNEIRFNSSNRNIFGQLIKSYSSGHFAQKSSSVREPYRTIKTPCLHVVSI